MRIASFSPARSTAALLLLSGFALSPPFSTAFADEPGEGESLGGVTVYRVESDGDAKALAALDRRLELGEGTKTLDEVVALFAELNGVAARIESQSLEDYGILPEDVEFVATSAPSAKALLDATLPGHDLGWFVESGSLVVTVGDEATYRQRQRVYDITGLAPQDDDPAVAAIYRDRREEIVDVIEATVAPESWQNMGGSGTSGILRMNGRTLLVVSQSESVFDRIELFLATLRKIDEKTRDDAKSASTDPVVRVFPLHGDAVDDELVDVVKEFVAPTSWTEEGVTIRRSGNSLLVRARPAVHAQIRAMLASMEVLAEGPGGQTFGGSAEGIDDGIQWGGGIPQLAPAANGPFGR